MCWRGERARVVQNQKQIPKGNDRKKDNSNGHGLDEFGPIISRPDILGSV
jgi:hypothetical protein